MKDKLLNRFFAIATLCLIWTISFGAIPNAAIAAPAISCDTGVKRCTPLKETSVAKYERCVEMICSADDKKVKKSTPTTSSATTAGVSRPKGISGRTCSVGSTRCEPLRDEPLFYWRCMADTCSDTEKYKDLQCKLGQQANSCVARLKDYWLCVNVVCRTPASNRENICEEGKGSCGNALSGYWECVGNECVGDINEYRNPNYSPTRKKIWYTDAAGRKKEVVFRSELATSGLLGVQPEERYPPKDVRVRDWLSIGPVPERRITTAKLALLACEDLRASITCINQDIGSCICSDGSAPLPGRSYGPDVYDKDFLYKMPYDDIAQRPTIKMEPKVKPEDMLTPEKMLKDTVKFHLKEQEDAKKSGKAYAE